MPLHISAAANRWLRKLLKLSSPLSPTRAVRAGILLSVLLPITSLQAAIITVFDQEVGIANNGKCSLIEAFENANDTDNTQHSDCAAGNTSVSSPDDIVLPNNGTFILTAAYANGDDTDNGLPHITQPLNLSGNGSLIQRQAGGPQFRIVSNLSVSVHFYDLRFRNGFIRDGGAIFNRGSLTLHNSTFDSNTGTFRGGVVFNRSQLRSNNSTFTNNQASSDGGGGGVIYNSSARATLNDSTFNNNEAGYGGALYNIGGVLLANDSSFDGNHSRHQGGAILNIGRAEVQRSTFSNNSSETAGAVFHFQGQLQLTDSELTSNESTGDCGAICGIFGAIDVKGSRFTSNTAGSKGGAIFNSKASVSIDNSKFENNRAAGDGGAIHNRSALTIESSIFDRNRAPIGGAINNTTGELLLKNGQVRKNPSATAIQNGNKATIINSVIESNARYGLYNTKNSEMLVTNSIITKNGASGVYAVQSVLNITNSTIRNHRTPGEAAAVNAISSEVVIDRSSIHDNEGDVAISISGSGTINRSTVYRNASLTFSQTGFATSGIEASGANTTVTIKRSTVHSNTSTNDDESYAIESQSGATITISGSIITNDRTDDRSNCGSNGITTTNSYVNDNSCGIVNQEVGSGLGNFGNYGGRTFTMPILASSKSAIKNKADCNDNDQRGVPAPLTDSLCDLGAVEQDTRTRPGISIASTAALAGEIMRFPVTLQRAVSYDVVIDYETFGGELGTDYEFTSSEVIINAGNTVGFAEVQTLAGATEGNTVGVSLRTFDGHAGVTVTNAAAQGEIFRPRTIFVGGSCTLVKALENANSANSDITTQNSECATGNPRPEAVDTVVMPAGGVGFDFNTPYIGNDSDSALPQIQQPLILEGNGVTIARTGGADFRLLTILENVDVTINDLTITGGRAENGGALFNRGNLRLNRSTLTGNQSFSGGTGGAIFSNGGLTINQSTLHNNNGGDGAAVFNRGGTVTINLSTLSNNSAVRDGGAVSSRDGSVQINRSTIAGNTGRNGDGLFTFNNGSIDVYLSLLAQNGNCSTSSGDISLRYSHASDSSCNTDSDSSVGAIELGPLQDNGGSTLTQRPVFGAATIDRFDCDIDLALGTDQRGEAGLDYPNIGTEICDLGAVEFDGIATADQSANTNEEVAVAIKLDLDNPVGRPFLVSIITAPSNGSVNEGAIDYPSRDSTGGGSRDTVATYVPNTNFFGTDSFTYVLTDFDGTPVSEPATVTINVANVNDAPVIQPISVIRNALEDKNEVSRLVVDDPDNDILNITLSGNPDWLGNLEATRNAATGRYSVTYSGTARNEDVDPDGATVTVTATDNKGGQDTFAYTLRVVNDNDAPIANDDIREVNEDGGTRRLFVRPNDRDPDIENGSGDAFFLAAITVSPSQGTATLSGNEILYTPNANFVGTDMLTYLIRDIEGATDTAVLTIRVLNTNDAPQANDDSEEVEENSSNNTFAVLSNDDDIDIPHGDSIKLEKIVTDPTQGTAEKVGNNIRYTPNADYVGPDSLSYEISDNAGAIATATLSITVRNVNDAPVAIADSFTIDEDSGVNGFAVLDNDSDPDDGDTISLASITVNPLLGVAVINGSTIDYTPNLNAAGSDSFNYQIRDADGLTSTTTVSITINNINDAPVAVADEFSVDEDSGNNNFIVLNNDNDPDSADTLTVSIAAGDEPSNGTATIAANNRDILYTPNASYTGPDSFVYTVKDTAGLTSTATVDITVDNVNFAPTAADDDVNVNENSRDNVLDVLANDQDPDGDRLVITITTAPDHGIASVATETRTLSSGATVMVDVIHYTPDADHLGPDSLTYQVNDGEFTANATVNITVDNVNTAPIAVDDNYTVDEDSSSNALDVLGNDSDPDTGDTLTVTVTSSPSNGSITITNNVIYYTPTNNYFGPDQLSYQVADNDGAVDTADVMITVTSVNDQPVLNDAAATADEDNPVTVNLVVDDPDNSSWTYTLNDVPASGTVSFAGNSLTYTPDDNINGAISFTVIANDGESANNLSEPATINITLNAVNDLPAVADATASGNEETPIVVNLQTTDADNDTFIYSAQSVSNGTVVFNHTNNTLSYTGNLNFFGTETFTVTANDGEADSAAATIEITVNNVNDAPFFSPDTLNSNTNEDTAIVLSLPVNDVDSAAHNFSLGSAPAAGAVSFGHASNQLTYTPAENATDSVSFRVIANDGESQNNLSNTLAVNISITPVNDAPTIANVTTSTDEDTPITVPLNTTDVDDDEWTYRLGAAPAAGTVTFADNNNLFTYRPEPNFNGAINFTVIANDGEDDSAAANIAITVNAVNDAPVFDPDTLAATVDEDDSVTIPLSVSDNDTGDSHTYSAGSAPPNGNLVFNNANKTVTYSPAANFIGEDQFTVIASDDSGEDNADSNPLTITIAIASVNDAPAYNGSLVDQTATEQQTGFSYNTSSAFSDVDTNNAAPNTDALSYSTSSILPNGLILASNGVLSGNVGADAASGGPANDGQYPIEITATDTGSPRSTATGSFTLSIKPLRVDLTVDLDLNAAASSADDSQTLLVTLNNIGADAADNVSLQLDLYGEINPTTNNANCNLTTIAGASIIGDAQRYSCSVAQIAMHDPQTITVTLDGNRDSAISVVASVTADQGDLDNSNNTATTQGSRHTQLVNSNDRDEGAAQILDGQCSASSLDGNYDFDGDGDADLITAVAANTAPASATINFYRNQDIGLFGAPEKLTVSLELLNPCQLTIAYDDSTLPTLIVPHSGGVSQISLNDDGSIGALATLINSNNTVLDAVVADLNNDGQPDIVLLTDEDTADPDNSSNVATYLNTGGFDSSSFPTMPSTTTPVGSATILASGDVDDDGSIDIVPSSPSNDREANLPLTILSNDGSGNLSGRALTTNIPLAPDYNQAAHISLVDIDNDGDLDIVITLDDSDVGDNTGSSNSNGTTGQQPPATIVITLDSGTGTVGKPQLGGNADTASVTTTNNGNTTTTTVSLSDLGTVITPLNDIDLNQLPVDVTLIDLNGDGVLDIVVSTDNGQTYTFIANIEKGRYGPLVVEVEVTGGSGAFGWLWSLLGLFSFWSYRVTRRNR